MWKVTKHVVRGGGKVLLNSRIHCIFTEFSPSMIREKGGNPEAFVSSFIEAGYTVQSSLNGPPLAVNETEMYGELWFILG